MSETIKVNVGKVKFDFEDEEGSIFASFRLNPMDIGTMNRCREVAEHYEKNTPAPKDIQELLDFENDMRSKFDYILGYKASPELFGNVAPLTILEDGQMFAMLVLDKIMDEFKELARKNQAKMAKAAERYTKKYT